MSWILSGLRTPSFVWITLFLIGFAISVGAADNTAVATFAGGCFWCVEAEFEDLEGILSVTSGYTGGELENPTYKQVSTGATRHVEAVQVVFEPQKISYEELLEIFWRNIDPTVEDRQFCDAGSQYRTAIFYHDDAQREAAEKSKEALQESQRLAGAIYTEINAATVFYPAEAAHQDYAKKNPIRYSQYRQGCGRDRRLEEVWGGEQ
jgi:peptide-methionine (S)-S-oxide reductase